jgi:hypothetical protein
VLDKSLQETHEIVAVAIDPIEQLLTPRVHLDLPRSMSIPARRQPSGHEFFSQAACAIAPARLATDRWLVPSAAIVDAGALRNICHSLKTASTPTGVGRRSGTALTGTGAPSRP